MSESWNKSTLTRLDTIFRNVTVVGSLGDWKLEGNKNTNIERAVLMFNEFKNKTTLESISDNYLMLHPDMLAPLPSLKNVMGMFRGCKIGKAIPFDLFKKRQEVTEQVWVKEEIEESYKEATLYTYNYVQEIYDMSHLFENCEWSNNCLQYDPALYTIKKFRVSDGDKEYQEYYTRTVIPSEEGEPEYIYSKHTLEQPTEITDAENVKGGYIANVGGTRITNPSINGDYNKLIIPPDLFYGLNATIDSTDTYNRSQGVYKALSCNTPLNGIVPTNIFKNNKTVRCDYLWENQVIIPQLVSTWTSENSTYNVYVPSGYTNYANLSNAFNAEYWKILLLETLVL